MSGLVEAVGFLTAVGGARRPTPAALPWFPLVGVVLGAVLGALWVGAGDVWPPLVAAVLVVAADLALTGFLHADGLVDSGDGLLPPLDRARRLAVMAAPDAGAFGVSVLVIAVVARVAALATVEPSILLLAPLWGASRMVMAVVVVVVPYARDGGLATAFRQEAARPVAALWVVPVAGMACAWAVPAGIVALVAGLAAGGAVVALARRRIGGFTGDVLGAVGLTVETVGLLVAAARW